MDIPRKSRKRLRFIRRCLAALVVVAIVLAITFGLLRLKPAAPTVHRATIWTDVVKRGPMVRAVRGTGRLVPKDIQWITATTKGRVERILVQPGTGVGPDTVLLELSNPELEKSVLDAEWQLKSAEAELTTRKVQLKNELLNMKAGLARLKAQHEQAKLRADVDEKLFNDDLLSERDCKLSRARVGQLAELIAIENERSGIKNESQPAELAVHEARIAQAKALHNFRRKRLDSLRVRAGTDGVLQQWEERVQVGRQVDPGLALAKISNPSELKAVVKISEVQARDVQVGQPAEIDSGSAVIPGHVTRIDPAAQQGTVAVDVALDGPLSKEARPDLTVVGTIEIERLENVLYVNRPVNGQPDSTIRLFKIEGDGAAAVQVKFGSSSVTTIEVREGLEVGDEIILSDMSRWDEVDRIRLK